MPSFRSALLLALSGALLAAGNLRASDAIPEPAGGASATVVQTHVTAELIPENTLVFGGRSTDVILHLHMDDNWHTYWINPGDAGLATTIKWTLPPGWTAGPIQWPVPEVHAMGPLTTYGYGGDVYLLTTLKVSPDNSDKVSDVTIHARAEFYTQSEDAARNFTEQTNAFLNLFRGLAANSPAHPADADVKAVFDSIKITQKGDRAEVLATIPPSFLRKLVRDPAGSAIGGEAPPKQDKK